jgi:predicted nucleotide-binding protein (sugar kinase/HSP70/actin superfamily)
LGEKAWEFRVVALGWMRSDLLLGHVIIHSPYVDPHQSEATVTQFFFFVNRREGVTTNQPRRMVEKTLKVIGAFHPRIKNKWNKIIKNHRKRGATTGQARGSTDIRDPGIIIDMYYNCS